MALWGYVLMMPGRPSKQVQMQAMQALGVDVSAIGPVWIDNLDRARRHRTAGQKQLEQRKELLLAVQDGDTVVVADPMCLGVSPQDAGWFLGELAVRGVSALVNGNLHKIEPGGDPSAVVDEFARRLNVYNSRKSRGLSR